MQLRTPRTRTRLVDPDVPAPGSVALTYGDGLILDATPPPKLQVDFGTGHDQVARGDAAPDAAAVSVDSSGFTGPASGTTTVQAALAALDAGGGGGPAPELATTNGSSHNFTATLDLDTFADCEVQLVGYRVESAHFRALKLQRCFYRDGEGAVTPVDNVAVVHDRTNADAWLGYQGPANGPYLGAAANTIVVQVSSPPGVTVRWACLFNLHTVSR